MFKRVNFGIKGAWLLENSDNPMYCILTTQYTNFFILNLLRSVVFYDGLIFHCVLLKCNPKIFMMKIRGISMINGIKNWLIVLV